MKTISWFVSMMFLCFLSFHGVANAQAACEMPSETVFNGVSQVADRIRIKERFSQFIQSYCRHNFQEVYELLSSSEIKGRRLKSAQEFVEYKLSFYSDPQTRFVTFLPAVVGEDAEGGSWLMQGCLIDVVEGERLERKATMDIWKERNNYFFSDINLKFISWDFKTEKCD